MDKKTFIKVVDYLREQYKLEDNFADAMEFVLDGRFVPKLSTNIMEAFRLVLISATGEDFEEWTSWWLYECNGIDKDLEHDWFIRDSEKWDLNAKFMAKTDEPLSAFDTTKEYAPRNAGELFEMIEIFNKNEE